MGIFKAMKRHIITGYVIIVLLAFGLQGYAQQGIQFSQYAFTGLTVNPAYAGYKQDWTLNLDSRLQWTGIDGAPKTGAISVDGVTNADTRNVGLGVVFIADQLGPQTTSSAYVNYAYRLRLNEDDTRRLSFGIGAGASQYSVNDSKFNATDGTDPALGSGTISKLTPDFRLGIYYSSPTFYAGLSALNLLAGAGFKDNTAVVREERTYYFTTGFMIPVNGGLDWKPSLLIKEDLKGPTNLDIGTNFLIDKTVWLGAAYRTAVPVWNKAALQNNLSAPDAVIGLAQIYVNDTFRIGYSYDFSMTRLANYQNGTHELSIGITFGRRKERILSPRYF